MKRPAASISGSFHYLTVFIRIQYVGMHSSLALQYASLYSTQLTIILVGWSILTQGHPCCNELKL